MIGDNIKRFRRVKNMTQEELSQKISVTRQAVSNWECGKTEPDIETIHALAAAFDIPADRLIKEEIIVARPAPKLTEADKEIFFQMIYECRARFDADPKLRQIIAVHTVQGNTYYQAAPWETWSAGDFRCEAALSMCLEQANDTKVRCLAVMYTDGKHRPQPAPNSWYLAMELLRLDITNFDTLVIGWAGCEDHYVVKPMSVMANPGIVKYFSQKKV